jgi:hypothetical protein
MYTFTKAQILALIASELPDNINNQITPEDLRGVLNSFTDMVQTADFIYYTHEDLAGVTHVKGALDAIVALIEAGTVLTAAQIVTLLESLTGTDRLIKSAVRGADFALNRRGKGNVTDSASYHANMTNILKGDYWVFDDGTGSPSDGGRDDLNNGDLVIALVSNATLYATATGYLESEDWEVYKFSSENNLTAAEIAALLNDNTTIDDMVTSNRIKHAASQTVKQKIDAMDGVIATKGKTIHRMRSIIESGESNTWGVAATHIADVITLFINRVPYHGVEGSSFNGYDFRFVYDAGSGNTAIYLNPSIGVSFSTNDIIDLHYTEN